MGSIVTLSILTDHMRELEADPAALVELISARMSGPARDGEYLPLDGAVTVHRAHHCSQPSLVMLADGHSVTLTPHALQALIDANPQYWTSERGLHQLQGMLTQASRQLADAERLVNATAGALATARREQPDRAEN